MIHLGRFVLIEINGNTGEGFILGRSNYHKITGSFRIYCSSSGKDIGFAEVMKMGEKYYMDVYDYATNGYLTKQMISGRKSFYTQGTSIMMDRNKAINYQLSAIYLNTDKTSGNFQVDKFPIVLNPDLQSEAYKANNWLTKLKN